MMTHGFANLVYDDQGGPRGDTKTFMTSMLMVMGNRAGRRGRHARTARDGLGRACTSARAAIRSSSRPARPPTADSADRPPAPARPLHGAGRARTAVACRRRVSVFVYVGLPGEPALGPPAFMHRFSGEDNPEAPIAHHWLDSTHITYGVATLG